MAEGNGPAMKPLRILHVVTSLGLGGAERVASELAIAHAGKAETGLVSLLAEGGGHAALAGPYRERLAQGGVTVFELNAPSPARAAVSGWWHLAGLIGRFRPDLVHSHTDIPDFCVSLTRRLRAFPIARTIHNTELWASRPAMGGLTERGIRDDLVIGVSDAARAAYLRLRARHGLQASPHLSVIRNPVPHADTAGAWTREGLLTRTGADADRLQLGLVGRLEHQKGVDLLLDALARLDDGARRKVHLTIVGDGGERVGLEAMARGLPVSFLGYQPDAARIIPAFDLLVVPSRFEGMGLVAVEAIRAGTPPLISDAEGLRESLPADWPLVFPNGRVDALRSALLGLIASPPDRKDLIRRAEDHVRRFDPETASAAYLDAYAGYLAQLAGRPRP